MTRDEALATLDEVEGRLDELANLSSPTAPTPGTPASLSRGATREWLALTGSQKLRSLRDIAKTDDEIRTRTVAAANRILTIAFGGATRKRKR